MALVLEGGGGCCVFILGVGARAGLASWRSPERTVGVKPLKACKICRRAHPGHRRSGAARWSRRRPRSTSLSWGSPCESLFRSHNWRWSDCSPGRRSERVRPGQPWLPVCHKTARITSLGEELLPLVVNPGPPSLAWPGPVASLLGYFFGWTPSVCVLFSRPSDTRAASLKETANEAPADTNSHTIARFFLATFRLNAAYVSGVLFINAVPPLGSLLADMFPLLYRTESSAARTYGCLTLYNCDVTSPPPIIQWEGRPPALTAVSTAPMWLICAGFEARLFSCQLLLSVEYLTSYLNKTTQYHGIQELSIWYSFIVFWISTYFFLFF